MFADPLYYARDSELTWVRPPVRDVVHRCNTAEEQQPERRRLFGALLGSVGTGSVSGR